MSRKISDLFKGSYDRDQWIEVLDQAFGRDRLKRFRSDKKIDSANVKSCIQWGNLMLDEDHGEEVGLFEVKIKPQTKIRRNRVNLRSVIAKACRDYGLDGALAIYHDVDGMEKTWRLSFVRMDYLEDSEKKRSGSKRFTYLLGEGQNVRTATERFNMISDKEKSLDSIEQVFSVEELNKEFYKKLEKWYDKAIRTISLPRVGETSIQKSNSVIRMITRLLFVWFIKEKGLINQYLFDEIKVKDYIDYKKPSSYYKAILQNLFFATLNQEISDRKMDEEDSRSYSYYLDSSMPLFRISDDQVKNLFLQSPFLNGGLFECHPEDGFSVEDSNRIIVPNDLFFDNEENGLIQILEQYRFTAEESTPLDVDVALDPELLGKVFENLLARHNPETSESARNKTGSFYTSRQVVNYIIDEALKLRLSKHDERSEWKNKIVRLIDSLDEDLDEGIADVCFDEHETEKLISAIYSMKIIDPAVGSGAFPMGVLHRLVTILKIVDPNNNKWKNKNIEIAKQIPDIDLRNQAISEIEQMFSKSNDHGDYSRKLYLIKNNIYGIDIQQIAVEIAKLRFFISLAIEQKPEQDMSINYGINSLPNLETNLIVADTLLKIKSLVNKNRLKQVGIFGGDELSNFQKEILKIREEYFYANDDINKSKCRNKDSKLREDMRSYIAQTSNISEDEKEEFNKICSWLPYDKNHSAEWFDPKWMFNVDGFDLVIGNPPYIQLQQRISNESSEKYGDRYKNLNYSAFARTGDIYQLFYERGWELLDLHGCLCFITSNKWMRTDYGKNMRKFLGEKVGDIKILDLGADVFETATVDTNILLFSKIQRKMSIDYASFEHENKKSLNLSKIRFEQMSTPKNDDSWILLNPEEMALKEKIERIGTPLKEWDISIYRGVLSGYNKAFIIDKETKDALIEEDSKSADIIRPVLQGRDIGRYHLTPFKKYLIATLPSKNLCIDDYPAIKKHLLSFGQDRLEQSGCVLQDGSRARKHTPHRWYELQDTCAYYGEFEKEKIAFPGINRKWRFILVETGIYISAPMRFITAKSGLKYIKTILESNIIKYYWKTVANMQDSTGFQMDNYMVEKMPILKISNQEMQKYISQYDKVMKMEEKPHSKLNHLIYGHYNLSKSEIRIIERSLSKI
ncbi:Eco57I restriction-modification methylase domain-containing protein [Thioalkalivibrio sp. HK1]|uniref:Eco57I restriction-modification methylase domain-containing protein n=1 Tax=Thioalkalivibrio sp. HK1 TaxID=1469245 RepID=UPI0009DFEED5|nr:Eco57I restriction-modification methylase domain-containing protein [Thioalkalivibrio sp. HK1]